VVGGCCPWYSSLVLLVVPPNQALLPALAPGIGMKAGVQLAWALCVHQWCRLRRRLGAIAGPLAGQRRIRPVVKQLGKVVETGEVIS